MQETKSYYSLTEKDATPLSASDRLWIELKERKLNGYRFERNKKVGNMTIDFYSSILHFAIIIDDVDKNKQLLDEDNQYDLEQMGIGFLRFTHDQIEKNFNYVLRNIQFWIKNWEQDVL